MFYFHHVWCFMFIFIVYIWCFMFFHSLWSKGLCICHCVWGFVFFHCVWWLVFFPLNGGGGCVFPLGMAVCCFLLCMGFVFSIFYGGLFFPLCRVCVFFLSVWQFVVYYCVWGLGLFHKQTADKYTAP